MNISENDYSFVESNNVDFYGIRLLTGKWKEVIYIYGKVSIKESPELDQATLGFTYNIQDPGSFEEDDLINDRTFKDYIGEVLEHVITNSLDNDEAIIGHNKSNTNAHSESSA